MSVYMCGPRARQLGWKVQALSAGFRMVELLAQFMGRSHSLTTDPHTGREECLPYCNTLGREGLFCKWKCNVKHRREGNVPGVF